MKNVPSGSQSISVGRSNRTPASRPFLPTVPSVSTSLRSLVNLQMTCCWSSMIRHASPHLGIHLDLVRATSARDLREQLFEVRPLADQLAVAIDDEDRVVPPPLPPALRRSLTFRIETFGIPSRVAARRLKQPVRRPRLRGRRAAAARRAARSGCDRASLRTPLPPSPTSSPRV